MKDAAGVMALGLLTLVLFAGRGLAQGGAPSHASYPASVFGPWFELGVLGVFVGFVLTILKMFTGVLSQTKQDFQDELVRRDEAHERERDRERQDFIKALDGVTKRLADAIEHIEKKLG